MSPPSSTEDVKWPVFAKLVGENVVFYMCNFYATLGRGTSGDETADFLVSTDNVISRLHAKIEYSEMEQGFELEVLGKNGVHVNGRHVTKKDRPVLLQSQMEISIGKQKPVVLSFLLPHASCTKMDRKKFRGRMATDNYNLVSRIGEALVRSSSGWLSLPQLVEEIWARTHRDGKNPFASKTLLSKNVQHVLTINRYFELGPPVELGQMRCWRIKPGLEMRFAYAIDPAWEQGTLKRPKLEQPWRPGVRTVERA